MRPPPIAPSDGLSAAIEASRRSNDGMRHETKVRDRGLTCSAQTARTDPIGKATARAQTVRIARIARIVPIGRTAAMETGRPGLTARIVLAINGQAGPIALADRIRTGPADRAATIAQIVRTALINPIAPTALIDPTDRTDPTAPIGLTGRTGATTVTTATSTIAGTATSGGATGIVGTIATGGVRIDASGAGTACGSASISRQDTAITACRAATGTVSIT